MPISRWKSTRMKLADLDLDEGNPRIITDEAREALQASIEQFGLVQPIVWNKRTGHVVGGHQRLQALLDLGEEEADVVVCDLDEAQEKALNIALNSEALQGDWDLDALQERIDELHAELQGIEFEDLRLDDLEGRLFGWGENAGQIDDLLGHWWGMPSFEMGDITAIQKIVVHFGSFDDVLEFGKRLDVNVTDHTRSTWFPAVKGEWNLVCSGKGPGPQYPIFIPSKGRPNGPTMARLREIGCPFFLVIEPPDVQSYREVWGEECLLTLPFQDLGKGSIPARNWIWDKAVEMEAERHWCIDDNIKRFYRLHKNEKMPLTTPTFLRCVEDFCDRYENVALAGLQHQGFVTRKERQKPFRLNTRIYSSILINTGLDHRWRGRHNEDTDLSLRALKDGWATILFHAFLMDKTATMTMAGGNTDTVYATSDHRREFAESLRRQHPDVVKVVWKFNRWHHEIDYSKFAGIRLKLKEGIVPTGAPDEYGMTIRKRKSRKKQ